MRHDSEQIHTPTANGRLVMIGDLFSLTAGEAVVLLASSG